MDRTTENALSSAREIAPPGNLGERPDIPPPVRRYLAFAAGPKATPIRYVHLVHSGRFRMGEGRKWTPIRGVEYLTISPRFFHWRGRIAFVGAVDRYVEGQGGLTVKLLSTIPVVRARWRKIDESELLRWTAESVWVPPALLPENGADWDAIDDNRAKITIEDGANRVEGEFHVDEVGRITEFKAMRYRDETKRPWFGRYGDYREVEGYRVPFRCEVSWDDPEEGFTYAEFAIDAFAFNRAARPR